MNRRKLDVLILSFILFLMLVADFPLYSVVAPAAKGIRVLFTQNDFRIRLDFSNQQLVLFRGALFGAQQGSKSSGRILV